MKIRCYQTHKKAEKDADCQDAYAISPANHAVAVADGVSQSLFPKEWAEMIVNAFASDPDFSLADGEKIKLLQSQWWQMFADRLEKKRHENAPLLWLLENAFAEQRSASATFVGMRFYGYKVAYEILGDSCLFLVRDNRIVQTLCSQTDENGYIVFNNVPACFDSNPQTGVYGRLCCGVLQTLVGDSLLLATDALAALLYQSALEADDSKLIAKLLNVRDIHEFKALINKLRSKGMQNDDTTLVCITVDSCAAFQIFDTGKRIIKKRYAEHNNSRK